MVYLVNSHRNASSKRWHLWEIDLRFALNSTPGWFPEVGWRLGWYDGWCLSLFSLDEGMKGGREGDWQRRASPGGC